LLKGVFVRRSFSFLSALGLSFVLSGCAGPKPKVAYVEHDLSPYFNNQTEGLKAKVKFEKPIVQAFTKVVGGPPNDSESFDYVSQDGFYKEAGNEQCYNAFFGIRKSQEEIEKEKSDWKTWKEQQMKLATNKEFAEQYWKLETEKQMAAIDAEYSKNGSRVRLCLENNFVSNLKVQFNQASFEANKPIVTLDRKLQLLHIKSAGVTVSKADAQRHQIRADGSSSISADTVRYVIETNIELIAKISNEIRAVPDASKLLKGGPNWGEWTALDAWEWSHSLRDLL